MRLKVQIEQSEIVHEQYLLCNELFMKVVIRITHDNLLYLSRYNKSISVRLDFYISS